MDHIDLWPEYREAVLPELRGDDELLIVDNGSEPPLEFATIYSETNLGFSTGSNVGLKHATCEAIVFVNNDVRLIRRGWLNEIRGALEPGVLVGQLRDGPHTEVDGVRFPYVDGWCLSGMREDLVELGGWDEDFEEPSYFGDNDLCLRARAAGMSLRHVSVGLQHLENSTAGPWNRPEVQVATAANHARYVARCRELVAQAA